MITPTEIGVRLVAGGGKMEPRILQKLRQETRALIVVHQPIEPDMGKRRCLPEGRGNADIAGRKLLDDDAVGERIDSGAAVFRRKEQRAQTELRSLVERLPGKTLIELFQPVALVRDGFDFLADEVAHALAHRLLLVREMQIEHAASFMLASAGLMRLQVHIEPRARDEFTRLPHARQRGARPLVPGRAASAGMG